MYQKEGKRIVDKKLLEWVVQVRDGACLYGLFGNGQTPCYGGLDPHHIVKRSANGDDVKENIITLCRGHHDMAENHTITVKELQQIMEYANGYTYL